MNIVSRVSELMAARIGLAVRPAEFKERNRIFFLSG
jgi:hypothetical protein